MSNINIPGAQATITVNTSQFQQGISRAQQVLSGLEPIVATQWWGLQNLSRAFGAVGSAVASGFGLAVREAVAWESAMTGVQRTTGATGEELKRIEQGLRDVASTTPIAASELADLAEQAGALGVENEDIPEFVRIMGQLIASTNLTNASVGDLARTMNVLGVPVEAFERFASTLLDVGRNTAATETEILNMARRLAPMAKMAGFTADQVLGLSAAILSLGPRAEAGSSAITRVIGDVSRAVAAGGTDLAKWAQIAGMSAEQFAHAWRTDASGAIEQIIVGLGKFQGDVVGLASVLDHLDQTNVRNIITLGALANGIADVNNEQTSLIAINNLSENAWRNNAAMQQVAEQRAKTFAAQMQMMRNRLSELANSIGQEIVPWLGRLLGLLNDMVAGFNALPTPLKLALGAVVGLVGALSLLAGGVLALIGPLVLMFSSWRAISQVFSDARNTAAQNAAGQSALTGAVNAQTGAVSANTAVWIQNRNAQGQFAKGGQWVQSTTQGTTTAVQGMAAAAPVAATATNRLWSGLSRLSRVAAVVTTVVSLAAVALTIFGHHVKKSSEDTKKATEQDEQLVDALIEVRKGSADAARSFLLQKVAAAGLLAATERLRISYAAIVRIIEGSAEPKFAAATVKQLRDAAEAGDEGARKVLNFMATQRKVYVNSAQAAGILTEARTDLGVANEGTAETEKSLAANTDKTRQAQEKANDAALDYVDNVFAYQRALLATKDALFEYNKALAEAADPAAKLAEVENELAQAQGDSLKAKRELAKAEKDLATARQDQLDELADAEDALADANDSYLDSIDKIHDLEEKIADLRSGASSKDLLDATNKLANAHLRLRAAEQGVEDAEWQLNYLREEGASNRDIADAEFTLDKARQSVADETENVADAENELREIRDGNPEEIIRLERELASLRRDQDGILRDIRTREAALQQQRLDIAADTAYIEAQAKVVEAQGGVYDSLARVRDIELELQKLRAGSLQDQVTKSQLDLEDSLVQQAKAATEAAKAQAALRKDFWDAGKTAHVLADNLSLLLDQAPTEESRKRLENYIAVLRRAKVVPEEKESSPGAAPPVPTSGVDTPGLTPIPDSVAKDAGKSLGRKIRDVLITAFSTLAGGLVGRIFMILIATFLGVTGGWAILAGLIIGALVGWLIEKLLKSKVGEKIIDGIISGIKAAIGWFRDSFGPWLYDQIVAPVLRIFGIESPSKVFADIGHKLIDGLIQGVGEKLGDIIGWFVSLPGWILEKFADAGSWLLEKGKLLLGGLWDGIVERWNGIYEWFSRIGSYLLEAMRDARNWLKEKGLALLNGIWDGIVERWNGIYEWFSRIGSYLWGAMKDAGEWLLQTGKNIIIGLWNGIIDKWDWFIREATRLFKGGFIGKVLDFFGIASPSKLFAGIGRNIIQGLTKGVLSEQRNAERAMLQLSDQVEKAFSPDVLAQFDSSALHGFLTGTASRTAALVGAATSTTNNNGDRIEVTANTQADPHEIANRIAWEKRVRRR